MNFFHSSVKTHILSLSIVLCGNEPHSCTFPCDVPVIASWFTVLQPDDFSGILLYCILKIESWINEFLPAMYSVPCFSQSSVEYS